MSGPSANRSSLLCPFLSTHLSPPGNAVRKKPGPKHGRRRPEAHAKPGTLIVSALGVPRLQHAGYMYMRDRQQKYSVNWRCTQCVLKKCRARATTHKQQNGQIRVVLNGERHSHPKASYVNDDGYDRGNRFQHPAARDAVAKTGSRAKRPTDALAANRSPGSEREHVAVASGSGKAAPLKTLFVSVAGN